MKTCVSSPKGLLFFTILLLLTCGSTPSLADEAESNSLEPSQDSNPTESPQKLYYEAMRTNREGNHEKAIKRLKHLLNDLPTNNFQDDALYRMAFIEEENRQNYTQSLAYYESFLKRFPQSRHARLVKNRVEYFKRALQTGEEPLRRFETLKRKAHKQELKDALEEAQDILRVHPNFVLRAELLLWQARWLLRAEQSDDAIAILEQIKDENPASEMARRAELIQGETYRDMGHLQRARAMFERLALTDGYGQDMAEFDLKQLEGLEQQEWFLHTCFVTLFLGLALLILAAALMRVPIKRLLIPSVETLLILPLVVGLAVFSLTQSKMMQPFAIKLALVIPLVIYLVAGIGKFLAGQPKGHKAVYLSGSILFTFGAIMTAFHWGDMFNQLIYEVQEMFFILF